MKNTTPAKKAASSTTAPAKKAATKSATPTKAPAGAATGTAAAKTAATKAAATKAAATKKTATQTPAATPEKAAARKTTARKATAKTATTSGARTRQPAPPQALRVREDETPWTAEELAEVRASIEADVAHLREEIQVAEADLVGLMRDGGDGAGDDQADAGAMTFEREHEISVANNAREMLIQNLHALERLDDGTYGICESCGNPIGKLRLQAAPRATLCMPCKTKQERR